VVETTDDENCEKGGMSSNGDDHDHDIVNMETDLNRYISDCSVYGEQSEEGGALEFWFVREHSIRRLAPKVGMSFQPQPRRLTMREV